MDPLSLGIGLLIGLVATAIAWVLLSRQLGEAKVREEQSAQQSREAADRAAEVEKDLAASEARLESAAKAEQKLAELERIKEEHDRLVATADERQQSFERERARIEKMEEELKDAFSVLSTEALEKAEERYTARANKLHKDQSERNQEALDELVSPFMKELAELKTKSTQFESSQKELIEGLKDELNRQRNMQTDLKEILRGPTQRGKYGEMQFEAMMERAGFEKGRDYELQKEIAPGKRPDCTIFLPDGGRLLLDVKNPDLYQQAMETEDEDGRTELMKKYARSVREMINSLVKDDYATHVDGPAMVIMYLPMEASFAAALQSDPDLSSFAMERGIVLASPTLFSLVLQQVGFSWKQELLRQHSQDIAEMGGEMVKRVRIVAEHFAKIGDHLDKASTAYNDALGSIQRNLLTQAERMTELGIKEDKAMPEVAPAAVTPKKFEKKSLTTPLPEEEKKALDSSLFD